MVQANFKYELVGDVMEPKVVQKFYVGSTYVYALQLDENDNTKVIFTKGRIPTDGSKVVTMTEKMTLTNFGHSQTLEYYKDPIDGQDYFWVAMNNKSEPAGKNGDHWATQIGKIQFKAGTTLDYTQAQRLTSLTSANSTGTAPFAIARTDAALSSTPTSSRTDGGKQRLMIMTSNVVDTSGKYQLSAYNVDTINAKLHASSTGTVSCKDLTGNLVSSYVTNNSTLKIPNGSWQGLEFADDNSVYFSGGHTGAVQTIVKGDWRFSKKSSITLSTSASDAAENLDTPASQIETEGIQLKGNEVLVGLEIHKNAHPHRIYSVSKSSL